MERLLELRDKQKEFRKHVKMPPQNNHCKLSWLYLERALVFFLSIKTLFFFFFFFCENCITLLNLFCNLFFFFLIHSPTYSNTFPWNNMSPSHQLCWWNIISLLWGSINRDVDCGAMLAAGFKCQLSHLGVMDTWAGYVHPCDSFDSLVK